MASNRHLGRIVALQTLYEYEFRQQLGDEDASAVEIMERNLDRYDGVVGDTAFVAELVNGVTKTEAKLDEILQPLAPEWPIKQIARIDRNILRLGLFELVFMGSTVPPKVAINEAVELAKAFGSDSSSRFINGVLGTAFADLSKENQTDEAQEKPDESSATGEDEDGSAEQDEQES